MALPTVLRWAPIIRAASAHYRIPASVLAAQIQLESGGREGLTSSAGAQGLTQFMPGTAQSYGVNVSPGHARSQIFGAAHYLSDLGFSRDARRAIAAYAAGPGNIQAGLGYADKLLATAKQYQSLDNGTAPVTSTVQQPTAPAGPSVPSVDQSGQRAALIANYLANEHDPNALISLATGLTASKPTASKTITKNAPAFDSSAPVGSYVNPHPGNSVVAPGRVDEGTDPTIRAGGRIVAVGNAKVVNVSRNFYKGLPYIVYKLTDGPRAGQYVYVSEYVTPKVRVGQTLRAGETVALGTGQAIEEGFAGGPSGSYLPLANRAQGGNYTEGLVTKPGIDWAKFSRRLGASTGRGY